MANQPFHRHCFPARHNRRLRRRIGIMGGSFNPAHDGHLCISNKARQSGSLDEVWWLVSPQNPLKSELGMADLPQRLAYARRFACFSWLRILDIESRLGIVHTARIVAMIRRTFPLCDFFWIMGADNLIQLPDWMHAYQLTRTVPIIVMNRPGYGYKALSSKGAALLSRRRRKLYARKLRHHVHGWSFEFTSHHSLSATQIRQMLNGHEGQLKK